jgi:hypothetical protein
LRILLRENNACIASMKGLHDVVFPPSIAKVLCVSHCLMEKEPQNWYA